MKTYENKFFVYDGKTLKAAQPTFNGAMRYFKNGRQMYNGSPWCHNTNITKIAEKINKYSDKLSFMDYIKVYHNSARGGYDNFMDFSTQDVERLKAEYKGYTNNNTL